MTPQPKTYQEFVEQHVCLLNALSDALEAGRAAIVSFRLRDFEGGINEQKRLCLQINSLHTEIRRKFPVAPANQESLGVAVELRHRLQEARQRLQQLNREQQALIRRSRRTVNAMLNGFRSFEGNYTAEALKQTSRATSLQERA